jgi:hypothetical protein
MENHKKEEKGAQQKMENHKKEKKKHQEIEIHKLKK